MAASVVPVRVEGVEVLVEAVSVAGSEPTSSKASAAVDGALDAFERAQTAILGIATSTTATIAEAARRGARPNRVELEFGLKFSATGNVIVAGASGEASLRVTLTYESGADRANANREPSTA